jgi:hypothetical protein
MNSEAFFPFDDLSVSTIMSFIDISQAFELPSLSRRTANFGKLIRTYHRINMKNVPLNAQTYKNPKITNIYIEDSADYVRFYNEPYFRSVKRITFGPNFNESVDNMPNGPEVIVFGDMFNHPTDHLPISTIMIRYGKNYDKPTNHLPAETKYVYFGSHYDQPSNNFPHGLLGVEFGYHYNQLTDNLPTTILWIIFGVNFNRVTDNFPDSLVSVTYGETYNQLTDKLPKSTKHIIFGKRFNQPVDNLPYDLETLELGKYFQQTCKNIPKNIKKLTLSKTRNSHRNITDYNHFFSKLANKPPSCIKNILWVNTESIENDDEVIDIDCTTTYNSTYYKQKGNTFIAVKSEEHIFNHLSYTINFYTVKGIDYILTKKEKHIYSNSQYILKYYKYVKKEMIAIMPDEKLLSFPTTCKYAQ